MDTEQQEGVFKTAAFGGFDKKSVLTYIDRLTEKHLAAEDELRHRMQEFSKAQDSQVAYIKKLESQVGDLEGKLDAVAAQLETERAVTPQATSQVNGLIQKNEELEKQVEELDKELLLLAERSRQFQFKAESMAYKSQKYDEMSTQIGDAMLIAKSNADKLVSDAQAKAEELLTNAQANASAITEQAENRADELSRQSESAAGATIEQAEATAAQLTRHAREELSCFGNEVGSFKGDAARLRKSIEEILFVLNDRVDVMQEIVVHMENRCSTHEEAFSPMHNTGQHLTAEEQPFSKAEDAAGFFGAMI